MSFLNSRAGVLEGRARWLMGWEVLGVVLGVWREERERGFNIRGGNLLEGGERCEMEERERHRVMN